MNSADILRCVVFPQELKILNAGLVQYQRVVLKEAIEQCSSTWALII